MRRATANAALTALLLLASAAGSMYRKGLRMESVDPTQLLSEFRGSYGRLVCLTVKALHDGQNKESVMDAFNGINPDITEPEFYAIRKAHSECNTAIMRCANHPQLPPEAVSLAGLEVRVAIEQEWQIEIDARWVA